MIVLLDYIIIAALAYFVFILFFNKKEHFEVKGYNTSNQDYSPVNNEINYNIDYIVNNFKKLLYEFTMEIERQKNQSSTITKSIKIQEQDFVQGSMEKRHSHIEKILNNINSMFNIPLSIIEIDKSYGVKETFDNGYIYLLFKIKITPEFIKYIKNNNKVIKKQINFEKYNKIFLALDTSYKIHQLRLYDIESIDANGVYGIDNNSQKNESLNNPSESNLKLYKTETTEEAEKYVNENHINNEGKCFIEKKVQDNIGFEVECKLNDGIWVIS